MKNENMRKSNPVYDVSITIAGITMTGKIVNNPEFDYSKTIRDIFEMLNIKETTLESIKPYDPYYLEIDSTTNENEEVEKLVIKDKNLIEIIKQGELKLP
jgi:hypothetical protein